MANNNPDIELIATLNENSSEAEILRVVKILSNRIKANSNAKIELKTDIDTDTIQKALKKLDSLMKSMDLSVDTKNSIVNIQKEADAMFEVVSSANKAAKEKLEFANANRRVAESAENTTRAIRNERDAMESLDDIDYILENINMQARNGNGAFQRFGNTLRDAFSTYTVANLLEDAIYKVVDAGKEAVETVKELDDINVNIQMATGEDKSYVSNLIADYNELGQELGSLTQDVANSADSFLRQGRSMAETNQLIQDSMVLSKVAKVDSEESSKILTATLNGFKLTAEEASRVNDILTSIDLESASDAGGIGTALSKTASMANNAGVSLEKTTAIIATMKDVTQDSDESIGNAVKSILSRMNQIRAGKFVDAETGEALNDVEKTLSKIGISMRDSNGVFKESEIIIDDVGQRWNTLDKNTQKAVATAMGGTYQYNKLISMFDNYSKVLSLTDVAMNSQGTALEKFENSYLPSLESKTNSLKASLENLASTTISDELYADVLDTTKAMVDMTAESGILKGALAGLGTAGTIYAFQQLGGYLRDVTQEFSNFGEALNMTSGGQVGIDDMQRLIDLTGGLTQSQTRLLLSTNNLTDAQKVSILMNQRIAQGLPPITEAEAMQQLQTMGLATAQGTATGTTISLASAMRGLFATLLNNPLVLVTTAVTAGVMAWNNYKQAQEEARQTAVKLTNEYQEEKKAIEDNIAKYKELKEQLDNSNLSTDEARFIKEQLLEVQNTLMDSYGTEASNLDLVNGKYEEQLGLLSELSKEKANNYVAENYSAFQDAKKALEKERRYDLGALFSYNTRDGMTEAQEQLYEFAKSYSDLFTIKSVQDASTATNTDFTPKIIMRADVETAEETIRQFQKDFEDYIQLHGEVDIDVDSVRSGISDALTEITTDEELNDYKAIYDEYMQAEVLRNDTLRGLYQESIQAVEDYNNALASGEGIEEAKAKLDSVKESVQGTTNILEGSQGVFDNIFSKEMTVDKNSAIANVTDAVDTMQDVVNDNPITVNVDIETSSSQLSSMREGITAMTDALGEKLSEKMVGADTLGKFDVGIQGLESWTAFEETMGDVNSSMEECHEVANALATEYVNSSDFLSQLTEENKDYYVSQLDEMGVINALEVVTSKLASSEDTLAVAKSEVIQLSNTLTNTKRKEELASLDLENATTLELLALYNEANAAGVASNGLRQLLAQKYNVNNLAVATSADCLALANLYSNAIATANALRTLAAVKAGINGSTAGIPSSVIDAWYDQATTGMKQEDTKIATNVNIGGGNYSGGGSGGGGGSSSSKSETEIDWIKQKLERLQEAIDLTKSKFENLFSLKSKKNNLDKQIKQTNKLLDAQEKAVKKYDKKASKVDLSKSLKKKVREGKITGSLDELIKEYGEKTANAIEEYRKWYDLARENEKAIQETKAQVRQLKEEKYQLYVDDAEAKIDNSNAKIDISNDYASQNAELEKQKKYLEQSYKYQIKIAELNKDETKKAQLQAEYEQALLDLEKQKFDNIQADYERQMGILDNQMKDLDNKISQIETSGKNVNKSYYESQKKTNDSIQKMYEEEKKKLEEQLETITQGTEEWFEALLAIQECENAISDCVNTTYELNNALNDLHFDMFNDISDSIQHIIDEQEFLQGLFAHEESVSIETGGFTDAGIARLGSISASYYASKEKVDNDAEEIKELQRMKDAGELTSKSLGLTFNSADDLEAKLNEMYDTWQSDIRETYDLQTQLADLMKEKYQEELDLLREMIDLRMEDLDSQKALHDYSNSINDKVQDINSIRKQIAAIQGDSSAEGMARMQKLQKELSEKEKDLEETEYEKYISDQKELLEGLFEETEDLVVKKLDDFMGLVDEGLDTANKNTANIYSYLSQVAKDNGYIIQTDANGYDIFAKSIEEGVKNAVEKQENVVTESSGTQTSTSTSNHPVGGFIPITAETISLPDTSPLTSALKTVSTPTTVDVTPIVQKFVAIDTSSKESMKSGATAYIKDNASKPTKEKKEYSAVNQKVWDLTDGKILSTDEMKELSSALGIKYNNAKKTGNLYKKLKSIGVQGFSKGGVVSVDSLDEQIKVNGDSALASVNKGERILTQAQNKTFEELVSQLPELTNAMNLIQPLVTMPKIPDVKPLNNGVTYVANYDNITLPNVTNFEEFKTEMYRDMQREPKFEKMVQTMATPSANGSRNRLAKNAVKF